MTLSIERKDHTIARLSGRLDALSATDLTNKVIPLITTGKPSIEFDCTNVNYISSSGLRTFVLANKITDKHGGSVIITGLSPNLKEIFDLTGLSDFFEFRD